MRARYFLEIFRRKGDVRMWTYDAEGQVSDDIRYWGKPGERVWNEEQTR